MVKFEDRLPWKYLRKRPSIGFYAEKVRRNDQRKHNYG